MPDSNATISPDLLNESGTHTPGQVSPERLQELIEQKTYSPDELRQLSIGQTHEYELLDNLRSLKLQTEDELRKFEVLDPVNATIYRTKFQSETSPERAQVIYDEIKAITDHKLNDVRDKTKINDNPQIQNLYNKVLESLEHRDVSKWLGSKQVDNFKEWYQSQFSNINSEEDAKMLLEKLHKDPQGIDARKNYYEKQLQPKLKHYGVNIEDTKYFREEGKSEREAAMTEVTKLEATLEEGSKSDLYIGAAQRKMVQNLLKSGNIKEMREMNRMAEQVQKLESQTYGKNILDKKITINGIEINALSFNDRQTISQSHKNNDNLEFRKSSLEGLPGLIKKAEKQLRELEEIYKDEPKKLDKAVKEASEVDYFNRQKFINKHRITQAESKNRVEEETRSIEHKSIAAINKARSDHTISAKTATHFHEYTKNHDNFKDEKTGELSLANYLEYYTSLTSDTPTFEREDRNLMAYAVRRNNFREKLKDLQKTDPEFDQANYKNRLDSYDNKTYSERKVDYLQLKEDIVEAKEKARNKDDEAKDKKKLESDTATSIEDHFEKQANFSEKDLQNEKWHDNRNTFNKDILARIHKSLSHLDPQIVEQYFKDNQNKIDQKMDKLYDTWLTEHLKIEATEENKEQKEENETFKQINNIVSKELKFSRKDLENEDWHKNPRKFNQDLMKRIQESTSHLDPKFVAKFFKQENDKLEIRLQNAHTDWLKQHLLIDAEEESKAKEQERAEKLKEMTNITDNELRFTKEDLSKEEWHDNESKFNQDLLQRAHRALGKFEPELVEDFFKTQDQAVTGRLNHLYQDWLIQHIKLEDSFASAPDLKIDTKKDDEEIVAETTEEEEVKETEEVEATEEDESLVAEEEVLTMEPIDETAEGFEEAEEAEVILPEETITPDLEATENIEDVEEEEDTETAEFKFNSEISSLMQPERLEKLQKHYSPEELEKGQDRMLQLFDSHPHLKELMRENANEYLTFLIVALSSMTTNFFQEFKDKLKDKKLSAEDVLGLAITYVGKDFVATLFSNKLEDTWSLIASSMRKNKEKDQEEEEEIVDEVETIAVPEIEEIKVEEEEEEEIIFKLKKKKSPEEESDEEEEEVVDPDSDEIEEDDGKNEEIEDVETEVFEPLVANPEREEETQSEIDETIIEETVVTEETHRSEEIELSETVATETEFLVPEPTQMDIEASAIEIDFETNETSVDDIEVEPETLFEDFETENFIDTSEDDEVIPLTPDLLDELYKGELNELPIAVLYDLIRQSAQKEMIFETLKRIELSLQDINEKQYMPLFLLFKFLYKVPSLIELETFIRQFTHFVSHYIDNKIELNINCPLKLQVLHVENTSVLFREFMKGLPANIQGIEKFDFNISEVGSYLNRTQVKINFTVSSKNDKKTTVINTILGTKDYVASFLGSL
jgi:hypothetical protein